MSRSAGKSVHQSAAIACVAVAGATIERVGPGRATLVGEVLVVCAT